MKCRLSQPSLAKMKFVLTRQKPVAQQPLCTLETATLVKILLMSDENVSNEIGVIEEVDVLRPDLVVRDVDVLARNRDHHCERISGDFNQKLERITRCRSVGITVLTLRWTEVWDTNRSRLEQGHVWNLRLNPFWKFFG
jgi:hypothetical protein